ncbi:hypothetical protein HPP92_020083 [Vanilla planifolia]|uniref:Cysteine--tRNA ligase n=1 Tax=Vanilla planifolia TaxID=51239 RepID=A0A835Q1Q4_VANPL|nr:hypothetical protein HPP92_020083 [Vanilla planifolia]
MWVQGKKQHMRIESLNVLGKEVTDGLAVLGLQPSSFAEALVQMKEKALKRAGITEEHVLRKIEERNVARKSRLYDKSDDIRRELAVVGIALMDGPDGTSWRPGVPLHLQEQLAPAA